MLSNTETTPILFQIEQIDRLRSRENKRKVKYGHKVLIIWRLLLVHHLNLKTSSVIDVLCPTFSKILAMTLKADLCILLHYINTVLKSHMKCK